jgi:putative SOS response-associated peptidase YedK
MPVLLHRDEYDFWLQGSVDDALAFQKRVFPAELMLMEKSSELRVKKKSTEPESSFLL